MAGNPFDEEPTGNPFDSPRGPDVLGTVAPAVQAFTGVPSALVKPAVEGVAGTAASLMDIPRALVIDPLTKSAKIIAAIPKGEEATRQAGEYTPEEQRRLISGLGGAAGFAAGGPAMRLAGPLEALLGRKGAATAAGALAGTLGAGTDAALRARLSSASPTQPLGQPNDPSTLGAMAFGAGAGGILARLFGAADPELAKNFPRSANPFSAPTERIRALDTGAEPPASLGPTPYRAMPLDLPPSSGPVAPPLPPPRLAGAVTVRGRTGPLVTPEPGDLFHGTARQGLTPQALDATGTNVDNLFGQGVYLTDNPQVAMGYAKARAKGNLPVVYRARLGDMKALDLEQPATDQVKAAYASALKAWPGAEGTPEFDAAIAKPGVTGEELHRALARDAADASHSEGISSNDFIDPFANVSDNLRLAGYDALQHTGGLRVGNVQHRVTILLDPSDAGAIGRKAPVQSFEPVGVGASVSRTPVYEQPPDPFSRLRALGPPPPGQPPAGNGPFDYLGMGPGRTIAHMIEEQQTRAATKAARSIQNIGDAGTADLGLKDRMALGQMLDGQPVDTTLQNPQGVKAAFDAIRKETQPIIPAMRQAGADVGQISQYYPRMPVPADALATGAKRAEMAYILPKRIPGLKPEEALPLIDDWRKFIDSGGKEGGELVVDAYNRVQAAAKAGKVPQLGTSWAELEAERAAQGTAAPGTQAAAPEAKSITLKQLRRMMAGSSNPKFSNIDFSRVGSMFYDPDPATALPRYLSGAHDRVASAQVFGPANEHFEAQVAKLPGRAAQDLARGQFLAARGAAEVPDAGLQGIGRALRSGGSYLMSVPSAMRNLTQGGNTGLTTDLLRTGLAYADLPAGYRAGLGAGATGEHALQGFVQSLGGEAGSSGGYLKGIGMTGTETVNRSGASGAASGRGLGFDLTKVKGYAQHMADLATGRRAPTMAERLAGQGPEFAKGELSRMFVRPEDIGPNGKLTQEGIDRAAYWITRRSQFVMNPADLPSLLTTSELGRTAGQFKPFSILQNRMMVKETLDRLRSPVPGDRARALRNLAILATVYQGLGEGSADARAAFRNAVPTLAGKRPLSRIFERAQPPKSFLERLVQNQSEMGGIGAASDFFGSLDYTPSEYLAGPAPSQAVRVLADVKKLGEGGNLSDSEKRRLVRLAPYIGPPLQDIAVPRKK